MFLAGLCIGVAIGAVAMTFTIGICQAAKRGDELLETRNPDFTENHK